MFVLLKPPKIQSDPSLQQLAVKDISLILNARQKLVHLTEFQNLVQEIRDPSRSLLNAKQLIQVYLSSQTELFKSASISGLCPSFKYSSPLNGDRVVDVSQCSIIDQFLTDILFCRYANAALLSFGSYQHIKILLEMLPASYNKVHASNDSNLTIVMQALQSTSKYFEIAYEPIRRLLKGLHLIQPYISPNTKALFPELTSQIYWVVVLICKSNLLACKIEQCRSLEEFEKAARLCTACLWNWQNALNLIDRAEKETGVKGISDQEIKADLEINAALAEQLAVYFIYQHNVTQLLTNNAALYQLLADNKEIVDFIEKKKKYIQDLIKRYETNVASIHMKDVLSNVYKHLQILQSQNEISNPYQNLNTLKRSCDEILKSNFLSRQDPDMYF